jgi:hypothetical protein
MTTKDEALALALEALEQSLRGMSTAIFGTDTYKVSSRGDFTSKVERQVKGLWGITCGKLHDELQS